MKKMFIAIICFSYLQTKAQLRLGIQGGYSISTFFRSNSTTKFSYNGTYSNSTSGNYHAGLLTELKLKQKLFFESGLAVSSKGTNLHYQSTFDTSLRNIQLVYLQIPVNLIYKWNMCKRTNAFCGGGMYAAHSIWGGESGHGYSRSGHFFI